MDDGRAAPRHGALRRRRLLAELGGTAGGGIGVGVAGKAEAVAAGAVLAVIAISIIPYAFEEVSSAVAMVCTLGFTTGYLLS